MNLTQTTPEQMRQRKIVRKGFQLCVLVCGHSGTGKSTFINSLCDGVVFGPGESNSMAQGQTMVSGVVGAAVDGQSHNPSRTMSIRTHRVDMAENDGTTIALTIVDTPGFGDAIDNRKCCRKIVDYVERQFDEILDEEKRVKRNPRFRDNRVHACLYFVAPSGHGLRELDITFMRTLSTRVNVIPVLAKADTLTAAEIQVNKAAIMNDIRENHITVYDFPCDPEIDDEELVAECEALRQLVPFAVVGSNDCLAVDGEIVRARQYPWGIVQVEDPTTSDFLALRSVLFGSHLQELRDLTHDVLYEDYRTEKLSKRSKDSRGRYLDDVDDEVSVRSRGRRDEPVRVNIDRSNRDRGDYQMNSGRPMSMVDRVDHRVKVVDRSAADRPTSLVVDRVNEGAMDQHPDKDQLKQAQVGYTNNHEHDRSHNLERDRTRTDQTKILDQGPFDHSIDFARVTHERLDPSLRDLVELVDRSVNKSPAELQMQDMTRLDGLEASSAMPPLRFKKDVANDVKSQIEAKRQALRAQEMELRKLEREFVAAELEDAEIID